MLDKAKLEAKMFRFLELSEMKKSAEDEMTTLKEYFERELVDNNMSTYQALLNADYDLIVKVSADSKKKFDADKMANDYNVVKADVGKKDFLIKCTEENKLTLKKFNEYFYYEPTTTVTVKKKKLTQKIKKQRMKG